MARLIKAAGPVTLSIDIGVIKMIITHAATVHGLDISPEPVDSGHVSRSSGSLIGKRHRAGPPPHHGRAEPPLPLLR